MITIKFDDKEVKEALNKLSKKLSDLSPVMREIAGIIGGEKGMTKQRAFCQFNSPPYL